MHLFFIYLFIFIFIIIIIIVLFSFLFIYYYSLDVAFCFVCPKLHLVHLVQPFRISVLVRTVMSVDCVSSLRLVLINNFKHFSILSHLSLFRTYHPRLVSFCFWKDWGDFPCPRLLAAWEIGAIEVVSLVVWSRPLLSQWLCMLMLPSSVTIFHIHNLLCKYISLFYLYFIITIIFIIISCFRWHGLIFRHCVPYFCIVSAGLMRGQLLPLSAHIIVGDSWV